MEEINSNEELIMRILWKLEKGLVRDILAKMDEPKPPYTTVSSIVRLLEKKGYIGHKAYGKTHEYFPLISQSAYKKYRFNKMVNHFFEGSASNVLSFMVKEKKLSEKEVDDLKSLIDSYDKEK
ncbi:BlaI/MecI/CopY family transcriptional regulator [Echinicola sp. 20G]|uniref:BlaI/MecI/CopY family transcriptional regulator n=1 Tax=Echinicola sp. 20G TaxID=2781961 RepID=UPI001910FDE4|nr:BlaI/MecI/CopY family transcriptional regulator [Echinicola sp. 20G]